MRATVVGGAADAWSRRRVLERRGEGSEAGGGAAGKNGEESPRPREGGDGLQNNALPEWDCGPGKSHSWTSYQIGLQCTQESLEKGRTVRRTRAPD